MHASIGRRPGSGPSTSQLYRQPSDTAAVGLPVTHDLTVAYVATLLLVGLMLVASVAGILLPAALYSSDPTYVSAFGGQDAANLVVGLPMLLGSSWLARRGSLVGLLLWPGALFYVLYTYALYLVGAPFNRLFLAYVALVVMSAYVTIALVASIDSDRVREQFPRVPARTLGGVLLAIGLLATVGLLVWLTPAIANPESTDPLLHARWIVDFTVGNPVLLIGGVLLWRHVGLGYTTAAGLLLLSGANGFTFAIGGVVGALLAATAFETAVIATHLAIALVCLGVLGLFLRGLAPRSVPANSRAGSA
jgi:hypothetical protein